MRVRCRAVHTETTQASRCRVQVELEWTDGRIFTGVGEGNATSQGMIRAGALATLAAAESFTEGSLDLELRGAKLVRAFDSLVVIIALRGQGAQKRYDLIGSIASPDDDLVRGAALAVLDATNRILERYAPPAGDDA